MMPHSAFVALLLCSLFCKGYLAAKANQCRTTISQPRDIPLVQVHGCSSSFNIGAAVGRATRKIIQDRIKESTGLQKCIAFYQTPEGRVEFSKMLLLHRKHNFGEYITELEGLAQGAGVPWVHVLLANMRQEMLAVAQPHNQLQEDSCSDVLLSLPVAQRDNRDTEAAATGAGSSGTTLVGHNEDMTRDTVGRVYFVHYSPSSNSSSRGASRHSKSSRSSNGFFARSHRHCCGVANTSAASNPSSSRRLLWPTADSDAYLQRQQMRRDTAEQQQLQWQTFSAVPLRVSHQPAHSGITPPTVPAAPSASSQAPQALSWLAFVYAGELASSGFAINSAGIGFTLNAVFPAAPVMPGISRNFVSRQLLEARSVAEALAIIGKHGQAVGHSYNLVELHSKRLWNVEVGPGGAMSVLEVTRGSYYFHANMYKHLVVRQRTDNSSYHREARALQLQAPSNAEELLAILGDTADPAYPIYRHGNSTADSAVVTLCTALWDMEAGTMDVWTGNPAQPGSRQLQMRFDLHTLQLVELKKQDA